MSYDVEDFIKLATEVEAQGGYVQPDACNGERLDDLKTPTGAVPTFTQGCGLHTRIALPYDPTAHVRIVDVVDHPGEDIEGASFAGVCAVCDGAADWPRFASLWEEEE